MKRILFIIFLVVFVMGCDDGDADKFIIRVKNETGAKLENVKVSSISGEEKSFGSIEAQKYSNYQSFNSVSRDPRVSAMIDNQNFTNPQYLSIWAGPPLDPGKYTYTLFELDTALKIFYLQMSED